MPRDQDLSRSKAEKSLAERVAAQHAQVLAGIGAGTDPVTTGRREIVTNHAPGTVAGRWVPCAGPHGSVGDEYAWPCDDYRSAAADAGDGVLPPERWS